MFSNPIFPQENPPKPVKPNTSQKGQRPGLSQLADRTGDLMAPKPQRQHYISKFLIKQWADAENNVGVVCQYHRQSAVVPLSGLHSVRGLWSSELENEWSAIENRANNVLGRLTEFLEHDGEDLAVIETFLSESVHLEALVNLVVLHYARSLEVPLSRLINSSGKVNSAAYESDIEDRWGVVESYRKSGIQVAVLPSRDPVALGAIPVFNTPSWGVSDTGIARLVMPLTPRLLILGTDDAHQGKVEVVHGEMGFTDLLQWQLAGAPNVLSTPYLVCKTSELERTAEYALAFTEGSHWHWFALCNRIDLCGDDAPDALRRDWRKQIRRCESIQRALADPDTTAKMKGQARSKLSKDANKIQTDLDALGVSICACKQHRANEKTSDVWNSVIPQVLCDAIRRRNNQDFSQR